MRKDVTLILTLLGLAVSTWAAGMDTCPGTVATLPFCECDTTLGAGLDHSCSTGHSGSDVVYQFTGLTVGNIYEFIGEASYDADWTVATSCGATVADLLCADRVLPQTDPSCSSLIHDTYGYMTYDWLATQTSVWVWIDSWDNPGGGDYCLEVLDLGAPSLEGDSCTDPFIIDMTGWTPTSGAYTTSGDTCGFNNLYTETDYGCGYSLTSKEVVYAFTPPMTLGLQIDLIGSAYDTKIVVTDGCPTSVATCSYNDDYSGSASGFDCTEFVGGVTYYVFVEGYSGACGAYVLNIDACVPPTATPVPTATPTPTLCPQVTCPSGGVPEGEPVCSDEYVDIYNGGCNSSPFIFQDIVCGDVICATSGTFMAGGYESRDTDWYRLEITDWTTITWQIEAEFESLIFILDAGTEDCVDVTVVDTSAMGCGFNTLVSTLGPGIYWLWAGPNAFAGAACPVDYIAWLTCEAAPSPTPSPTPGGPGDDCTDPLVIDMTGWTPGGTDTYTTNGDTCAYSNQYTETNYGCGYSLASNEVVYQFTPPVTMGLQIDLIGSAYDTKLVITDGCPGSVSTCLYNDDYSGVQSGFDCTYFTGGVTYYLFIEGYNVGCGAYVLNIDVCVPPTPTPTPTPTVTPTSVGQGDDCANPFVIDMTGWTPGGTDTYTTSGDTCSYGDQYNATHYGCGTTSTSKEVVYQFTPPVTMGLQIDLLGSAYDTKLWITDGCPGSVSTCLYSDDYASTLQSGFDCTTFTGGVTYYIFVEGYSSYCGAYVLNIDVCIPPTPTPMPTPCPQITCPSGATQEGEPLCGPDYEDTYNGGCNSSPYIVQDIECGDVICGKSGTYLYGTSEYRDTDWYRLTLATFSRVTWTANTEFPSLLFIIDAGTEDCVTYTILEESTAPCGPNTVSADIPAGVYWLFIAPNVFTGVDCDSDYVVQVTCQPMASPTPCMVTCPSGGVPEGEPDCGPEYVDTYNGGCNSSPYVFQDVSCGDIICGTSGTYLVGADQTRDTDWFRLELTESKIIHWTVNAEFPVLLFILGAGTEDCITVTTLASGGNDPCVTTEIMAIADPGVYWLWVGPAVFSGYDCPLDYVGWVECEEILPYDYCPTGLTFARTANLAIPDVGCPTVVSDTMTVLLSEYVEKVTVKINATHTYDGDLNFWLSHAGRRVSLVANRGSGGDNFTETVFDDDAQLPIQYGSAPFTGAFQPEGSLAAMQWTPAGGDWTIEVCDSYTGDTGTLVDWELCIDAGPLPPIPSTTPIGLGLLIVALSAVMGIRRYRK